MVESRRAVARLQTSLDSYETGRDNRTLLDQFYLRDKRSSVACIRSAWRTPSVPMAFCLSGFTKLGCSRSQRGAIRLHSVAGRGVLSHCERWGTNRSCRVAGGHSIRADHTSSSNGSSHNRPVCPDGSHGGSVLNCSSSGSEAPQRA
jgi:hypothetical protein